MIIPEGGIWRHCFKCDKEGTEQNVRWIERFECRYCDECHDAQAAIDDAAMPPEFIRYKHPFTYCAEA